ncbi:MAG: site-specific DNA-methyltransferase [Bacteroidetes bacterium]|nr:site-specific DNA-methyltransferase [Bacteroidota bacterium]
MTELIWEGKYKDNKKVAPVRIALPFQTIETVNESAQQRQKTLDFFASGKTTEWRNRLIWGDKKYVLPSLLPEFAGKVNLIYIDPPFNVGSDFSFTATIPDNPETEQDETISFTKEPNVIEQKAYRDTWGRGLDSYLQWFYETILLLRELLSENGSIYVHLDWRLAHYAKTVLDEVFGYENFRNDLRWKRQPVRGAKATGNQYARNSDIILFYSKSEKYIWNNAYKPYDPNFIKEKFRPDKKGRLYRDSDLGDYSEESIAEFEKQGKIYLTKNGNKRLIRFLDEEKGEALGDMWVDIPEVNSQAKERVNYPTQKPEELLERAINASSNQNDLVLDCFCGSGTTATVSEKLNRRWITCDLGRFAIHTARKRFLEIKDVKPFVVQNLGKYERQQWVQAEFENTENRTAQEKAYRNFILDLYHAKSITGYVWLHGSKAGRMVHIGNVDSPVSNGDVKAIVQELWKSVGKKSDIKNNGIDILGWDFAFELNETAKEFASKNKVDLKFKKIPNEALEKKAVEQGDVKFYELAYLDVKVKKEKKKISLTLNNFVVPPDDIPEEVLKNITHWSQWIDYWAVDWNYGNDTFHNEWQSYRTKQNSKIELSATNTYEKTGKYTVIVKVIDILGNDTTKAVEIEV